ncbi:MAG: methylamine methyltransferase corrinoid protein reductive activase [Desulfobacteraceae bacterium]|jgi:methylamine methyltransferase corrinoid protein reductive activase
MSRIAIAMDLGTSGLRAQAIDLSSREIISTVVTTRHPMPGTNVMDHLHFALEMGVPVANSIMIEAVNKVIGRLGVPVDCVNRLGLCGNPVQLSLFQGIEIRDLAYAGKQKLESLGIVSPKREAMVLAAQDVAGLELPRGCEVIIPPAIRHEIGADALAMIIQTGMLDKDETSLATDYGTNAEMALFHSGRVITASTSAGPALEGQQISCGMLAAPGAVSDLDADRSHHRTMVLNSEMLPVPGPVIHLANGSVMRGRLMPNPIGITGTGTVAVIHEALAAHLIVLPRILTVDGRLHLGQEIYFTEDDLVEAGKAIGAVRAGHVTLCQEAGIALEEICTAYMSGASGTYVDAIKAQKLGMIPPRVKRVYQVGNTSLAMARDLVTDIKKLEAMSAMARQLEETHCMFAASQTFKKIFMLELAYWAEGMSLFQYRRLLVRYGFPDLPPVGDPPVILRTVQRDIDDLGRMGLTTMTHIGRVVKASIQGCVSCWHCVEECPENALFIVTEAGPPTFGLDQSSCSGVACRRCERVCPEAVFELNQFFLI